MDEGQTNRDKICDEMDKGQTNYDKIPDSNDITWLNEEFA